MSWEQLAILSNLLSQEDITIAAGDEFDGFDTSMLKLVSESHSKGFDYTCFPLTTPQWKDRWTDMCLLQNGAKERDKEQDITAEKNAEAWRAKPVFLKDEVNVTRLDEAEGSAILVSDWLPLDAADEWVRHDAEIALQQEVAYAAYLNIMTAILPAPRRRENIASYARAVNQCLKRTSFIQLSVRLPIYDPDALNSYNESLKDRVSYIASQPRSRTSVITSATPKLVVSDSSSNLITSPENVLNATWEMWDVIRSICDYDPRLTLTLDLTLPLPSSFQSLSKWQGEPVRHVIVPATTFIPNNKGYPVLPKATQTFLRDCMIHRPILILGDTASGLHPKGGEDAYLQYVRHLEKTSSASVNLQKSGTVENFAAGYQDFLQAPLQPLMDNLQGATYQTFEQDPVKYRLYEEAMYRALKEWPHSGRITFCIAGAGRGPLVARCLSAVKKSKKDAFVYVVEKNPNAFVTLQHRKQAEWGNKVELLFGDMRMLDVPEQVDILVSELLGSFGDNELSPECLDGAVRFLKPDGISIPSSYTAHMAPLSSSKLFNEARAGKEVEKALETPYVVMFNAVNIISGDGGGLSGKCGPKVQECWEFEHPRKDAVVDDKGLPTTNSHNVRAATLNFHIPYSVVLHGLAGYFEAVLYGNVGLSIHPQRKDMISKDMLSWFPLFFPFKEPLFLPSNCELQVSIWRLTNQRQVWYEWYAESFLATAPTLLQSSTHDDVDYMSLPSPRSVNGFFGSSPRSSMSPSLKEIGTASPLIDALDSPRSAHHKRGSGSRGMGSESDPFSSKEAEQKKITMIKIGQTSLHNPQGRSSFISLVAS